MIILGIDPGLQATGYGVITEERSVLQCVAAGDIRPSRAYPLARRLEVIHGALAELITCHRPETVVLEKIFTHHHHVTTAAMMGHARGVACLAVQEQGVALVEYPSTLVKKSLTGNGHASKEQVARMVRQWLRLEESWSHRLPASRRPAPEGPELPQAIPRQVVGWSADATDALALAIVHAQAAAQQRNLPTGVLR